MQFGPKPAYESERPWPSFQTVRPSATGIFGSGMIGSDYYVIKQDDPTNEFKNGGSLQAYSNGFNDYDGSSGGLKTIIIFKTPLDANKAYYCAFTNGYGLGGGPLTVQCQVVIASAGSTPGIRAIGRLRLITAAWTPGAFTWDEFDSNPPTMGITLQQDAARGGTFTNGSRAITGSLTSSQITGTSDPAIYGIVIDVTTLSSFGYVLSSQSIQFTSTPPIQLGVVAFESVAP